MIIELHKFKEKLDNVGCGFCLAKWTQVTMHLHNGLTHSCHHPIPHKISLEEIKSNPTALHNTKIKKAFRKQMLQGKRPSECDYCWKVEDVSNSFSDRTFKSSESWSEPFLDDIKNLKWDYNYIPKYLEVSFSNACNFKCAYCGPSFSSKWVEECNEFGKYTMNYNDIDYLKSIDQLPYKHTEYNPYVEAFWKWWPDLYKDLHTFRITGGEPLLSVDTWKILDFILETDTPNRKLNFSINTNLGVPKDQIEKLVEKLKIIMDEDRVNGVVIYTSCESWGEQAEYTRFGLDYKLFMENIRYILTNLEKVNIIIMSTFNALSVFKYDELIEDVFQLKEEFLSKKRYLPSSILLDTSYLRWPPFLSIKILEDEQKELILKSAKKAFYYSAKEYNHNYFGFSNTEIQKIKRTYDYSMSSDEDFNVRSYRRYFVDFVEEYDKRRGTNFLETFPEMLNLYNNVKNKRR